jgi:hypothetical protein
MIIARFLRIEFHNHVHKGFLVERISIARAVDENAEAA